MSIDLKCPACGQLISAGDDVRGRVIRCPGCGGNLQVPNAPGQAAAPQQGPFLQRGPLVADILSSIKRIGVFNIIVGCLSLAWAMLMLIEIFAARSGFLHRRDPSLPPVEEMVVIFSLLFIFSLISGLIQLLAGIFILQRKNLGRTLGLISGFLSCFSLWTCCGYPFCLGSGIYTLIVLFGENVRNYFVSQRQFP